MCVSADYFVNHKTGMFVLTMILTWLCAFVLVWCCSIGRKYMQKTNISKGNGNLAFAKSSSVEYKNKTVSQLKKWGTLLNVSLATSLIIVLLYYLSNKI